jgi:hypothetical protein
MDSLMTGLANNQRFAPVCLDRQAYQEQLWMVASLMLLSV